MILNKNILNNIFGYSIVFFPIILLIGPLLAEVFLLFTIIYSIKLSLDEKKKLYLNYYIIFFILFYLSTLSSTLYNYYNFDYSKSGIFFFRVILFAFAISIILKNFIIIHKSVVIFYILFFFTLIADSLFQYYAGYNFLGFELLHGRVSSFFNEELILGSFLIKTIPIFIVYLVIQNKLDGKKSFLFYSVLLSFVSILVYLSGERTSFFLLLLFYFILFLLIKKLRLFIFSFCAIAIFLLIFLDNVFKSSHANPSARMISHTYHQLFAKTNTNYDIKKTLLNKINFFTIEHQNHYKLSLKISKDHLLVGTGVKGFRYLCRNQIYILKSDINGCSTHPHNTYFQLLTSNGLIGLSLLIIAYVYIIGKIFCLKKKINLEFNSNKNNISKLILLIAFFVNFWPLAPSGNFFNNWLSIFYFYQIGLYLYFDNESKREIS